MHNRFAIAACAASLLSPCVSFAADDVAAVIVTATRFPRSSIEEPISVQVITADEIRDSTATNVSEVLAKIGGVPTRINFVGVPDTPLDLRGFGMSGDQNTLVIVDGQRLSENELASARISSIPLNAIERIEILRGAGAVLYGSGATGGIINIVTRSPLGVPNSATVFALAGDHGTQDLRADGRFGSERSALDLHVQHFESDNYRANNRAKLDSGSGQWRLGDADTFVALRFAGDRQRARLPGARTEAQLRDDPRGTSTPNDYFNTDSERLGVEVQRRMGDFTLAADLARREKRGRFFNDFSFGLTSLQDTAVSITSFSPRVEWRAGAADMNHRLVAGVDWADWNYGMRQASAFGDRDESGTQRNLAWYLRDELSLPSRTRLTVGVRKERIATSQQERITPLPKTDKTHELTATELAALQVLGAGWSAYARLGQSYRIANIDENRCFGTPCPPLLEPQRSKDREIGAEWRRAGASFKAALFDVALTNEIHYNSLTFSNMNLSPTHRRGVELDGRTFLGQALDLHGRYTHTTARFDRGIYGGVDVTGNEVPLVPRQRASLNIGWQAGAATRLVLSTTYVGAQRYDNDQANRFRRMPAYTLADVKLSHDWHDWRLAAGINNLFDKAYYSYGIVNGAFTSFNAYPETRRNAYVSAAYRF